MSVTIAGAILAGGRGERIGGSKALVPLLADPLVAHVAAVLRPAVDWLAVVGDRQAATIVDAVFLRDETDGAPGPLAGVLSALEWAVGEGAGWLAIAPCDTPLLPADVVQRFVVAAAGADAPLAYATTSDGEHPLVSVWRTELSLPLRTALAAGHPAVRDVMRMFGGVAVRFDDGAAFLNVNTPVDLARAEALLIERRQAPQPRHRS